MRNRFLRILHISDIHRGPNEPTSTKSLLGKLLTDIRRIYDENNSYLQSDVPKLGKPDIIIVSGDLTQRAAKDEFKEAHLFLSQLLPLVDDDKGRIVIVPGNHDIDWSISAKSFSPSTLDAFEKQRIGLNPYRQSVKRARDGTFWLKNDVTYVERFRPFKEFFDSFYDGLYEYSLKRDHMFTVYDFRDSFGLVVVGFNSVDEIDAYRDAKGDLQILGNRGSINSDAVYTAVEHPVFSDLKGSLLLAVFHHNIRSVNYGEDFIDPSCIQVLRQQGFELCLHGHVHDSNNDNFYDAIQDKQLPVIGAGSLAAPYEDRLPAAPQGYNLIVVDSASSGIWVHTRRSDERNPVWTPDYRWNGRPYFVARDPGPVVTPIDEIIQQDRLSLNYWSYSRWYQFFSKALSPLRRLTGKSKKAGNIRAAYRDMLITSVGRVRLLGSENTRELLDVFVSVSVAEEYGGLLTDHGLIGLMDANLRHRVNALYDTSIDPTDSDSTLGNWTARKISPLDLQNAGRRAILTGSPGSGKTTLLKFLALHALREQVEDFVVFLELKSVTVDDLKNYSSLPELLFAKAVISRLHLSDWEQNIVRDEFFAQLNAGRARLYLDGLDEVSHQTIFDDLCRLVSEFATDPRYSGTTLLVSARPFALHRASLEGLPLMEIQPLERNHIKDFLHAYYPYENFTDNLITDLNKPGDLQELARVPAMLAVIISLYRRGDELGHATKRLEIYERITRWLITKIDREKNARRFSFRLDDPEGSIRRDFLQRLAFEQLFGNEGRDETDASRFVFGHEDILAKAKVFVREAGLPNVAPHALADDVKATPLLREIAEDKYAFTHITFHEFLAASALAVRKDNTEFFSRIYFNPVLAAQEVLPMALGLADSADPFYELLEKMPESLMLSNYLLRVRGLGYAAKIDPRRLEKFLNGLALILIDPWNKPEGPYRRSILKSLWFIPHEEKVHVEKRMIPYLKERSFKNINSAEVLSVLGSEESFEPLVEALQPRKSDGIISGLRSGLDDSLQRSVTRGLVRINGERAMPVLASIRTYYSYGDLDRLLKDVGTEDAYRVILQRRKGSGTDWQTSKFIEEILNQHDKSVGQSLTEALNHPRYEIRCLAVDTLGIIGLEESALPVAALLRDSHFSVRWKAASALERIGSPRVINQLLEALQDNEATVRWCAIRALDAIASASATDGLINALRDPDEEVQYHAALALASIGSGRAVEPLLDLLTESATAKPRVAAAYGLYRLKDKRALAPLIACLRDPNNEVRAGAAFSLGSLDSEEGVDHLVISLGDPAPDVRANAAFALGRLRARKAIPYLLSTFERDQNDRFRQRTIEALGRIGSVDVVGPLLRLYTLRFYADYAAAALANLNASTLRAALPNLLHDADALIRRKAAEHVGYYRNEPGLLEELAQLASSDPDAAVRATATKAATAYTAKLKMFNLSVPSS